MAKKLMAVKSLRVKEWIQPHVPDFDVVTIGTEVLAGPKYIVIFVAFEPATKQECAWVESLRRHLHRNGSFIY